VTISVRESEVAEETPHHLRDGAAGGLLRTTCTQQECLWPPKNENTQTWPLTCAHCESAGTGETGRFKSKNEIVGTDMSKSMMGEQLESNGHDWATVIAVFASRFIAHTGFGVQLQS